MKAAILLSLVLATNASAQDAQKLFDAMQSKVRKAKAFQLCGSVESFDRGALDFKAKIDLVLADGNRVLLKYEKVSRGGKLENMTVISDGKRIHYKATPSGTMPVRDKFSDTQTTILCRFGLYPFVLWMGRELPPEMISAKVSELKFICTEKVAGRNANVIEYMTFEVRSKVWLDEQTNLPLKRVTVINDSHGIVTTTETYKDWLLNPDLPKALFSIAE